MKNAGIVLLAVAAGLLGLVAGWRSPRGFGASGVAAPEAALTADVPAVRVGDRLPDLRVPGLDGRPRALRALLAGRPGLVNFWATWCGPCRAEMPALSAFAREQGANGVQVVGIAIDDPRAVRAYTAARPTGYPVLVDAPAADDASARLGDVRGVLPYSVLVSADGRILRQHAGALSPGDLAAWAREARPTGD